MVLLTVILLLPICTLCQSSVTGNITTGFHSKRDFDDGEEDSNPQTYERKCDNDAGKFIMVGIGSTLAIEFLVLIFAFIIAKIAGGSDSKEDEQQIVLSGYTGHPLPAEQPPRDYPPASPYPNFGVLPSDMRLPVASRNPPPVDYHRGSGISDLRSEGSMSISAGPSRGQSVSREMSTGRQPPYGVGPSSSAQLPESQLNQRQTLDRLSHASQVSMPHNVDQTW